MGLIVGIDLGTTFSAVAQLDPTGRPKIVNNRAGKNTTPSVVEFLGNDKVEVGEEARKSMYLPGFKGAGRFKREMGTSMTYDIDGSTYTPTELSTFVLKKLAQDTEAALGPIETAVVTSPANFANEARDATLAAGKAAGLNIEHIINEPTAAALYYSLQGTEGLKGQYAVYDLGGGTFDISIINVEAFEVEVLAANGVGKLGGDDFDRALHGLVRQKYEEQTAQQLEDIDFSINDAEEEKISLSRRDSVLIVINREQITVTRSEYEESISSLIAQTQLACEGVMDELDMSFDALSGVFLVGGSTRTPAVEECVRKTFGREPTSTANVDEVVALGAAFYAAYKSQDNLNELQRRAIEPVVVQERTNMCFGTISLNENHESQNTVIIPKGEKIPCSKTDSFYTVSDHQEGIKARVTESRAAETDPTFVNILKEGYMKLPPGRPAGQEIKITYSYNASQIMECEFRDVESGSTETFTFGINGSQDEQKPTDPEKIFIVD